MQGSYVSIKSTNVEVQKVVWRTLIQDIYWLLDTINECIYITP